MPKSDFNKQINKYKIIAIPDINIYAFEIFRTFFYYKIVLSVASSFNAL